MDEFPIEIEELDFPKKVGAISVFKDEVHWIFVNRNLNCKQKEAIIEEEKLRKPF